MKCAYFSTVFITADIFINPFVIIRNTKPSKMTHIHCNHWLNINASALLCSLLPHPIVTQQPAVRSACEQGSYQSLKCKIESWQECWWIDTLPSAVYSCQARSDLPTFFHSTAKHRDESTSFFYITIIVIIIHSPILNHQICMTTSPAH